MNLATVGLSAKWQKVGKKTQIGSNEMSLDQFLDTPPAQLEDGIGLALSGGGYRAMVFHVGALIRLNEVALLRKVKRISSVSGGSIKSPILRPL